jgi:hypothetical protein
MPAACGIACEVCGFLEECGGCMPGTDPRAPARLEQITQMIGMPCPMLECAIKNNVDYCLRCPNFPCDVAYQEIPYSKKLLDVFKGFKENKN